METKIINEDIAEMIGIMIGDGCISQYTPKARLKPQRDLLITGSWEQDSVYYKEFVQPVIQEFFGYTGRLYHRKDDNTARYWITNKNIVNWFVNIGLPVGSKIDKVKIPVKIVRDRELAVACIRGIFNTDGCVFRRYSKQYKNHSKCYSNYAVIEFKIRSEILLRQIKKILEGAGIKTTEVSKNKIKAYVLRITSQPDVAKFMEIVKPRKYHADRYKSIVNKKEPPEK